MMKFVRKAYGGILIWEYQRLARDSIKVYPSLLSTPEQAFSGRRQWL